MIQTKQILMVLILHHIGHLCQPGEALTDKFL